jgi:hypothetical protein
MRNGRIQSAGNRAKTAYLGKKSFFMVQVSPFIG